MILLRRRKFLSAAVAAGWRGSSAQRTVVVGDVHGDLSRFQEVLAMAGVIDARQAWMGGSSTLVQLGDLVDSGPNGKGVIELLMRLESEARKSKGRVYTLIGNHEAMRMHGDLRSVSAAEYETFCTPKSEQERDKLFQAEIAAMQASDDVKRRPDLRLGFRQQWERDHPLGEAELRREFSVKGRYGKWLLAQRAALVHHESLFVHGGISARFAGWSESRLNAQVRGELAAQALPQDGACLAQDGPLWYRGLAELPQQQISGLVEQVLANFQVKRIIVGHTPQEQGILSRLGGKVIVADTGLARVFGGRLSCLLIENGEAFALEEGNRVLLR